MTDTPPHDGPEPKSGIRWNAEGTAPPATPAGPNGDRRPNGSRRGLPAPRREPAPVATRAPASTRLPTGTVERSRPGLPWWRYRPADRPVPEADVPGPEEGTSARAPAPAAVGDEQAPSPKVGLEGSGGAERGGLVYGLLAALCGGAAVATGRMEIPEIQRFLIPVAAILAAVAFGHVMVRRHPDEPWLLWLIVLGVVFKLVASAIRYDTLIDEYGGGGDAGIYDKYGRGFFEAWHHGGEEPDISGSASAETNWIRWFTGVVYYIFGPDMLNGFLVFGLFAVVGAYLWYRAAVMAVPFLDKRLFGLLVFFLPSIAFWPAAIGKEALMQLGIGAAALGTAYLFRQQLFMGLLVAAPGAWLLWRVRPHLLALVVFAAGAAYFAGRVRKGGGVVAGMSVTRPLGLVIVIFLVFFAVNQGADFLGMEEFSVDAVEQELEETSGRSDYGGSTFDNGDASLSPLTLPQGLVTVLLRPFPWEVDSSLQILASLECAAVTLMILFRFHCLTFSLRRSRVTPFLMYCWTLVLLYAVAFSSLSNFGILVRQRSLVLPALFVLLAVDPALAARAERGGPGTEPPQRARERASDSATPEAATAARSARPPRGTRLSEAVRSLPPSR